MCNFLLIPLLIFAALECAALAVFKLIRQKLGPVSQPQEENGLRKASPVLKGLLERLMLTSGLLLGYPTVLVVFGALKVATRLRDSNDNNISNDYFLVGNLCSLIFVFLACLAVRWWWHFAGVTLAL